MLISLFYNKMQFYEKIITLIKRELFSKIDYFLFFKVNRMRFNNPYFDTFEQYLKAFFIWLTA